jgi:hypothetical protein
MRLGRSFYSEMDDDEIAFWKSQGFIFDDEDDDDDEDEDDTEDDEANAYADSIRRATARMTNGV